jgi:hypothetical protein
MCGSGWSVRRIIGRLDAACSPREESSGWHEVLGTGDLGKGLETKARGGGARQVG